MDRSQRKKLLDLGEWLERFLNPKIMAKGYRKLAHDFIRLYNVDYVLSEDDITLQVFGLKDKSGIEDSRFVETLGGAFFSMEATPSSSRLLSRLNAEEREVMAAIVNIYDGDVPPFREDVKTSKAEIDMWKTKRFLSTVSAYNFRNQVQNAFRTLVSIVEGGPTKAAHAAIQEIWEEALPYLSVLSETYKPIFAEYNNLIVEKLIVRDGKFQRVAVFSEGLWYAHSIDRRPSAFPWGVAVSKVFFDFLIDGGQDFFLMCDYCERFTVSRRRGSKRFCSDICRSNFRLDRLAGKI